MTTIAIRDGVVACDSRISSGGGTIAVGAAAKAYVNTKHRVIFTGAGIVASWHDLARRLAAMRKLPWQKTNPSAFDIGIDSDTVLYVVDREGAVYCFESKGWYKEEGKFHAAGSGQDAALAAMHMGASAYKAVEIACLVDSGSGLPVKAINVIDL